MADRGNMTKPNFSDYIVYVDESGDHSWFFYFGRDPTFMSPATTWINEAEIWRSY